MKKLNLVICVICLGSGAQPALANSDQFDLACSGEREHRVIAQLGSSQPWSGRIRVDLAAHLFCSDECRAPEKIAEITPERIVLRNQEGTYRTDQFEVDRVNGKLKRHFLQLGAGANSPEEFEENYDATCKVGPFSGFPKAMF